MRRPKITPGRRFTQIMHEHRETHRRRGAQAHGALQGHHHMHARVDFRMPARRLRYAVERRDLRKNHFKRSAVAQGRKEELGPRLPERTLSLLPNPFGHEGVDFAGANHVLHEGTRFRGDCEAALAEARREARHPQYTYRIFDKGV